MFVIRTYTNTKCELEMAKTRLNLLIDRRTGLYSSYFPLTSQLKQVNVEGGVENEDKMADYLHDLHCVDIGTGKSLAEEIEKQQEVVIKLESYIRDMDTILSKLKGIEYDLYYEIVVNGTQISKAISLIAEKYDKDDQTIWKHHYRKIKRYVKKVDTYRQ